MSKKKKRAKRPFYKPGLPSSVDQVNVDSVKP